MVVCALIGSEEMSAAISEEMEHILAISRKFLEGMGLEEKQVESIIEANAASIEGIKSDRDKYKEQAEKVPDLQKQLEEARAASTNDGEWEKKFNDEHQAFESFKSKVESEKADAAKAQAYRAMLAKTGVDPKRIDAIMRVTDLSKVEMEDGSLKESGKLEEAAKKEWADFIVKTKTEGSNPANPPASADGVKGADPEIVKRLQERHERKYGKTTEQE